MLNSLVQCHLMLIQRVKKTFLKKFHNVHCATCGQWAELGLGETKEEEEQKIKWKRK